MNGFAQKLKKIREESQLSQKAFAERLGIGPVTMNRLEKGNQAPDVKVLIGLRTLFGADLNWLLNEGADLGSSGRLGLPIYNESQLILPGPQRRKANMLNVPGVQGDFAYRVRDEAMLPLVRPGDYVVIENQGPSLGDLLLCLTKTGIAQVRRVSQTDDKFFYSTDNPEYGQIVSKEDITVLGKIIRIVRAIEV